MKSNLYNKKKRGRMRDLYTYRKDIMYNLFNKHVEKEEENLTTSKHSLLPGGSNNLVQKT